MLFCEGLLTALLVNSSLSDLVRALQPAGAVVLAPGGGVGAGADVGLLEVSTTRAAAQRRHLHPHHLHLLRQGDLAHGTGLAEILNTDIDTRHLNKLSLSETNKLFPPVSPDGSQDKNPMQISGANNLFKVIINPALNIAL